MRAIAILFVVVVVSIAVGVGTGAGTPIDPVLEVASNPLVSQLDWLQNLIERVDRLLEAVVDLVTTVRELVGGEGGD